MGAAESVSLISAVMCTNLIWGNGSGLFQRLQWSCHITLQDTFLTNAAVHIWTHQKNPSNQSLCPNLWQVGIVSGKSSDKRCVWSSTKPTAGPCWFVAVCPGLYCTGSLDISFPLPVCGASLFRHWDRCSVSPLGEKWVKLLFSTLQFTHVERRGWGKGSAKWISFSWRNFPVSLVHLDPGRGELPLRSGEGSKSRVLPEGSHGAALPWVIQHLHIPRAGNQRLHGLERRVSTFCCQTYKFN